MEIRTSTVAVVAASCITIGAAGAYLANRPSPAPEAAPAANVVTGGVEQSEAVVSDAASTAPADNPADQKVEAAPRTKPVEVSRPAPTSNTRPSAGPRVQPGTQQARTATAEPTRTVPSGPAARPEPREPAASPEPTEPIEPKGPPEPKFVDLVISTDSVLGLQVETALTSEKARVEDEVMARVTRDVRVGDRVAIPAGSQARGEVTMVERGGKVRDRARLGIRFTSVVLADGTRLPVETDTIYREGDSPAGESTAKIGGGAIGGAIIGGLFGGAKGAAIGAATGAGAGTAAVVAGGRNAATLPSGTPVTVRLIKPATVTIED